MRTLVENWQIAAREPKDWSDVVPGGAKTAASMMKALGRESELRYDAHDWWFRAMLPTAGTLVLEGLATVCEVFVDDELVLRTSSMFRTYRVPVKAGVLTIRCRALDELLAQKRPRPRWKAPMVENQQLRWFRTTLLGRTPGWSPPFAAVGPWRDVWIEEQTPTTRPHAVLEGTTGVVTAAGEIIVRRGEQTWAGRGRVEVPEAERWWPHTHGTPALYDVVVDGRPAGRVGFRTMEQTGDFALSMNGIPVFCRGACWTPLDARALRSSRDEYRAALVQAADAGMNMIRVGGTMVYESEDFYDLADELGILIWHDFMFANMDIPEDEEFLGEVRGEITEFLARLRGRPSVAVLCGNSEGEQQAAMFGAPRDRWSPALFHELIPAIVEKELPGIPYWPSSAHGGAFPHENRVGTTSYYGVGAYLRPLEDARRSEVRFATECLAFANIPALTPPTRKMHHAAWKERVPRDLGAGWDFEDVRDHYVKLLFGVDPAALRYADHERYLALGRAAVGEVMATTFGEWRRARSVCGGALVWFLRDLWEGAGWGVVGADGTPKSAYWYLRRALAPLALHLSDEGTNGVVLHVANDGEAREGELVVTLYRAGEIEVGRAARSLRVAAHETLEIPVLELFEGFRDLSFAYRFGPPSCDLVVASFAGAEAFHFPVGLPRERELDVGLTASAVPVEGGFDVTVKTRRFAQSITFDADGFAPSDAWFHLAPGGSRTIRLRGAASPLRGYVQALNGESPSKIA